MTRFTKFLTMLVLLTVATGAWAQTAITLSDTEDNSATLTEYNGQTANVTLSGRTLYKDGSWNTLCLPFDVTIRGSVLAGATAKTLESTSFTDGTLTLTFGEAVSKLEAGKPYIIKWESGSAGLTGKFTINSSGDQITFASGNLQYKSGETYPWSFAANQWDYVGTWDTSSWIDLFGWGAWTGDSPNPTNTSLSDSDYRWDSADFTQESKLADESQRGYDWRTLTRDEWVYLLQGRTVNGGTGLGKSYTRQSVNGVLGVVIYPDGYTGSAFTTGSDWSAFEAAGCVFLPAAGQRNGTTVELVGEYGNYWSSTPNSANRPSRVRFYSGYLYSNNDGYNNYANSVRLVRKAEEGGTDIVNPVFEGVTINNATAGVSTAYADFKGDFSPITIDGEDNTILYLGADNKLYYPNAAITIGSCRAFFHLAGITAGDPSSAVKAFVLNFEGEDNDLTGIESQSLKVAESQSWYDLSGRKLSGKPTESGIYINNGKKVIIK